MHDQAPDAALARVELQLVAHDEADVANVRREAGEVAGFPRTHDFDLTPGRRVPARSRHHRHGARVFPDAFAGQKTTVRKSQ
jgi:hypothetical protein